MSTTSEDSSGEVEAEGFDDTYALVVQVSRCYDALMQLLALQSPADAAALSELHEKGGLMSPAITLDPELAS